MENSFLKSSIGKKLVVALSGLFLMSFLMVHLLVNLMLIIDDTGALFNKAAHFMATNPAIRVVEPLLALGFGVHILYTIVLTIQNLRSRPIRYSKTGSADETTWASRNMFILGGLIATFLVMHLFHFFIKMKFTGDPLFTDVVIDGESMKNGYLLVSTLFKTSLFYSIIYLIGAIFLGLHLVHGFWSAFQSIGMTNKNWLPRLKTVALVFAVLMGTGFSIIPLYFILFF